MPRTKQTRPKRKKKRVARSKSTVTDHPGAGLFDNAQAGAHMSVGLK